MQRRVSLWRIVLALLLIGAAWLTHRAWPQKQWSIHLSEKLLGFDVPAKLFYTIAHDGPRYELKGYDLYQGTCVKRVSLHPVTTEFKEPEQLRRGETAEAWNTRVSEQWKWGLSSNKRELLTFNEDQAHFQVLDIETGQCQRKFELSESRFSSFPMHLCFSPDGRYVAIDHRGDQISLWDLQNSLLIAKLKPRLPVGWSGPLNTEFALQRYRFNTQHRLIIASDGDLKDYGINKSLIPPLSNPCLMDDGQHILFTPRELSAKEQPVWYHSQPDGSWVPSDIKLSPACTNAHFLAYTDQHLVTDRVEKLSYPPPGWVKASWWQAVVDFLSLNGVRHHLQFWNKHNGQLAREFSLPEPEFINPAVYFFPLREGVQLSEDGNWLLHTGDDTLTLWNVSGSRSWACWTAIATLFALATWTAWPRNAPLSPPGRSGHFDGCHRVGTPSRCRTCTHPHIVSTITFDSTWANASGQTRRSTT